MSSTFVLHRHKTTLKRSELCSTRTKWSTGSRLTTHRLQTSSVCLRLLSTSTCRRWRHLSSSSAPGPLTRLSYSTSCSTTGPSQPLSLLRPSSVSAAVALETVVHPARPSSRTPSAEVAVDLLASSGTSNLVIFVFYVAAASSCWSSSATTRHYTTSSTTSVLHRRLRPYPHYMSRVQTRRLGTFVCKLWVLTNLRKMLRSSRAWVVLDWLLVAQLQIYLYFISIINLSYLSPDHLFSSLNVSVCRGRKSWFI